MFSYRRRKRIFLLVACLLLSLFATTQLRRKDIDNQVPESISDVHYLHDVFLQDLEHLQLYSDRDCELEKDGSRSTLLLCAFSNSRKASNVTTEREFPTNYTNLEFIDPGLCPGGRYIPRNCTARSKVAIIVPYRNRPDHLKGLLYHLHTLLPSQNLEYQIYVIEQVANQTFNKAQLLNIGYLIARRQHVWDCYVFHDVDMYPLTDRSSYSCSESPRLLYDAYYDFSRPPHIEVVESTGRGKGYLGGVCQLKQRHMDLINGYSNLYWGWGAEEKDIAQRLKWHLVSLDKTPRARSLFTNNRGQRQKGTETGNERNMCNREMRLLMEENQYRNLVYEQDGINSVKARILYTKTYLQYTLINVDLLEQQTRLNCSELIKFVRTTLRMGQQKNL